MTEKRFTLAFDNYDGWAMQDTTGEYSDDEDYFGWLTGQKAVDVMNHFAEENEQLKERNQRQAKRLGELYELMEKKDWESLTEIIDDFCSCEEQLQREWKCYE